jgi:hypothetical protein
MIPELGAGDDFAWLIRWYHSRCNREWEESYGIKIETLDNPGWRLEIDLRETPLDATPFDRTDFNLVQADHVNDEDMINLRWYTCRVEDRKFQAHCGTLDLPAVVAVFRRWAEAAGK